MTTCRTRTARPTRHQDGRPLGTGGAVAAIGAVVAMLAVLHLTCTPAAYLTGPAADTETVAHPTGLAGFHDRGTIVLLDTRR